MKFEGRVQHLKWGAVEETIHKTKQQRLEVEAEIQFAPKVDQNAWLPPMEEKELGGSVTWHLWSLVIKNLMESIMRNRPARDKAAVAPCRVSISLATQRRACTWNLRYASRAAYGTLKPLQYAYCRTGAVPEHARSLKNITNQTGLQSGNYGGPISKNSVHKRDLGERRQRHQKGWLVETERAPSQFCFLHVTTHLKHSQGLKCHQ